MFTSSLHFHRCIESCVLPSMICLGVVAERRTFHAGVGSAVDVRRGAFRRETADERFSLPYLLYNHVNTCICSLFSFQFLFFSFFFF